MKKTNDELIITSDTYRSNIAVVDTIPSISDYLACWLKYCEKHQIPYGLPKIQKSSQFCDHRWTFWIPKHGLCCTNQMHTCWNFRESYRRLGVHTKFACFWNISLILSTEELGSRIVSLAQSPAHYDKSYPYYTWQNFPDLNELKPELARKASYRLNHLDEFNPLGHFCFFERDAPKKRWSREFSKWVKKEIKVNGGIDGHISSKDKGTGYEEILATEIMKTATKELVKPDDIIIFHGL